MEISFSWLTHAYFKMLIKREEKSLSRSRSHIFYYFLKSENLDIQSKHLSATNIHFRVNWYKFIANCHVNYLAICMYATCSMLLFVELRMPNPDMYRRVFHLGLVVFIWMSWTVPVMRTLYWTARLTEHTMTVHTKRMLWLAVWTMLTAYPLVRTSENTSDQLIILIEWLVVSLLVGISHFLGQFDLFIP